MASAAAQITAFLETRTFLCVKLRLRLQPEECCRRQAVTKQQIKKWGFKMWTLRENQDQYCASGKCAQGKLVKLERK